MADFYNNYGNGQGFPNIKLNGGNPNQNPKMNEGSFTRGVLLGVISALLIIAVLVSTVGVVLLKKGYIHISTDGSVYVQSEATDDDLGIGSDVSGKLNAIESLLDQNFLFDNVDKDKAEAAIYKAYLDSYGDKYTVYYTADEYEALVESTTGKFYGVGAICAKNEDGTITLVQVYDDSPAKKAGLQSGDIVKAVDGQDITSMELSDAIALIKGDKGTDVELTIIRDNAESVVKVTRGEVNVPTVDYTMMADNIGYIVVSQFDEVTTKQFKKAIDDLTDQGMVGLVVDIRDNPGGMLKTVEDMLDYILPNGLIVYTEDVNGNRDEYNGKNPHQLDVPVAVLVNGNSASASEIFAGAVQDYELGAIVGTQTFGKGIVQTIQPLTDGSAIKYTIAKYFTPKGQDIHGVGVTPDIKVEYDAESQTDNQLDAAINFIKGKLAN